MIAAGQAGYEKGVEVPSNIFADAENVENAYHNPRIKPGGVASGIVVFRFNVENEADEASKIVFGESSNEIVFDLIED